MIYLIFRIFSLNLFIVRIVFLLHAVIFLHVVLLLFVEIKALHVCEYSIKNKIYMSMCIVIRSSW